MAIAPSAASVQRARAEAEKEDAYWHEHYSSYLSQYPDQFVAVARTDGRLVAADPDLDALISSIRKQGLDVQHVWARFMVASPIRLAL